MELRENRAITYVFVLLTGLTLASWWLAEGGQFNSAGSSSPYLALGIFALAFFKVRLVIMYFMELKHAPLILRALFEAWVGILFLAMCFVYLTPDLAT